MVRIGRHGGVPEDYVQACVLLHNRNLVLGGGRLA